MARITVLVASSPTSPPALRAFQLVRDLTSRGHQIALGLLEDGVLGSTGRLTEVPLAQCAVVMVQAGDLALRGLGSADLHPGCRPSTYGEMIAEIMAGSDRVLGAF